MVIRTQGDPLTYVPAVREAMRSIDPDQPIDDIETLEHLIGRTLAEDRVRAYLLGAFAGLAFVLAVVGLYAVLSYTTAQRSREIGIRLALGAEARDVLGSVVGQGMKRVVTGMMIGLAGGAALIRLAEGLLFEVTAADPGAIAVIVVALFTTTLVACGIPARRAATTDPVTVLKQER